MRSTEMAYHPWAEIFETKISSKGLPVPLQDPDAYLLYPHYRWMFNKLTICEDQGIAAFPHEIRPERVGHPYPVFSKPVYNLRGSSAGARRLDDWQPHYYRGGHFWMELLEGPQLSTDVIVANGRVLWHYAMAPAWNESGSFSCWTATRDIPEGAWQAIERWVATHLKEHRGATNFETIGDKIIEAPPRPGTQFFHFYGEGWLDALIGLVMKGAWQDPGPADEEGISYVVRVSRDYSEHIPHLVDRDKIVALEREHDVGIWLPWRDGKSLSYNRFDDGLTHRLAFINARNIEIARQVEEELRGCIRLDAPAYTRQENKMYSSLVP